MYKGLKAQELREALIARGLDSSGTRTVLIGRLEDDDDRDEDKQGQTKKRNSAPARGSNILLEANAEERTAKKLKNSAANEVLLVSVDRSEGEELEKKARRKRNLGLRQAPHVAEVSEEINIGNGDQDFEIKCVDNEQVKDINSFSVSELRAALDKRSLSTVGTKKLLYDRLIAHDKEREMQVKSNENEIKCEEAKGSDGINYEKEKKIVLVTKKGRAVLDVHLPDNVKVWYHVLGEGTDIYDAMLNQTNVGGNNNKFYVIQVLEPDSGCGDYLVYTRWGRVGVQGRDKMFDFPSKELAIMEFKSKFYEKTRNNWETRQDFKPEKNKYTWLERDYTDGTEDSDPNFKKVEGKKESAVKSPLESKLDRRLAEFISYICNIDMMRQQMLQIGYDATQLPLGKLSKTTILKGYECLKKISAVLDHTAQGSILELSSEFYTVIPHDFGFQKMRNFIIDTPQKLKRKLEMVEALGEIQLATTLFEDANEEDDPIYNRFKQLNCHLEPLQHDSEEFHWINCYVHNTHAETHSKYKLEIIEVFRAHRDIEQENFGKFTSVKNRMLLWHGSRLTNWTGILSQGLRIAPPEAPVTGYMFGKGVYFSDMVSKSANYCYASPTNPIGVLLLCEVALGDMWELKTADYNADRLPPGKLSTKGLGGTEPNPKEAKVLPDGVIVPLGKPVKKRGDTGSLLYNEYIVYDVSQIQMRYVLQVKFKYR